MEKADIAEITGIRIGHAQNLEAGTGCTVILCEKGGVAGVEVRGGSPGTRETDALDPVNNRREIHGILLAGGSAFGLDAAGGVMRYLEERGVGRDVGVTRVPNVCGAILFDLKCGDPMIRPDAAMGYEACRRAGGSPAEGCVGAGTGCTVGKVLGHGQAMKGGLGVSAFRQGELLVGAVAAVNCVGDVYDAEGGRFLAGVRQKGRRLPGGTEELILADYQSRADFFSGNTIIGCVITNAKLDKPQAKKLASISHNGIARCVRPAHSIFDGDTLFTLCTGEVSASQDACGILAARTVERAVLRGIQKARGLYGHPACCDLMETGLEEE